MHLGCKYHLSDANLDRVNSGLLGLAPGVRGSVVRLSHQGASFVWSRLRGDDGVKGCRCHLFDTLVLTPHRPPMGQRLPDFPDSYAPLNGRGLSSGPVKGGPLQCEKKNSIPKYQ